MAEIYTFTLVGGTVLRYSAAATQITVGANTWTKTGLNFKRGSTKVVLGLETDQFDLTVYHDPNDPSTYVNGQKFADFVRQGGLDGAVMQMERVFMAPGSWGDTSNGTVIWFYGLVSNTAPGRSETRITVKDLTEKLNQQWPRRVVQASCIHTLYDSGCTLNKAAFAVAGTVGVGSTTTTITSNLANADDYFSLGFVVFNTGAAAGQKRSIKTYAQAGGVMALNFPLTAAPANGDTFTVYPGCDKMMATCGGLPFDYTVDPGTDVFTFGFTHEYTNGQIVKVTSTGTPPAPLIAGTAYYVIAATALTLQLSATSGGAAINITTAGTGVQSMRAPGKFDNIVNFGGFPFVPTPETAR